MAQPPRQGALVKTFYHSTRSGADLVTSKQAILAGIASDGGLYVSDQLGDEKLDLAAITAQGYHATARAVLSALLCLAGVGFLTVGSGLKFGAGEMFCMLAAFLYACTILITDRLTHGSIDALAAGIVQVGTIGVLSLSASFLFEAPRLPVGIPEWAGIVMLAVVCTGFGFTLQPVAQSGTSAERAGMFCALNPMVATILGIIFLQERFTVQSAIGGGLILAGILVSELPDSKSGKARRGAINPPCIHEPRR